MLIKQILGSKASDRTFWVTPEAKVSEAAKIMSDSRIGTVVVSPDGKALVGILSERDIVREIGRNGSGCLDDAVTTLMTSKITTCKPEDSDVFALQTMTDGRFRHLPVMQDGEMIGLVSIGDVVKARLSELAMEKSALEGMIMGH